MKRIVRAIGKFFASIGKAIYKVIDKILITPFSKLAYLLTDKLGSNSSWFEKFLNKPNTLLYVSLLCAFLAFVAIDRKIITLVETEAIVLSNQTVSAEYNEEAYVVEGLPSGADIVLMGRKSDLYLAEQLGDHKITLDLSTLSAGTHKVKLKYNNPINTLDYKLDPSSVTLVIHPKVSEVRTVTTDILNTDKLNETLVVSSVTLDRDEVIIKSYKEKLERVASVKAIVDVNSLNAASSGTYTLENAKLVAYDESGAEIQDIEIVPETVTATVVITSPSKTVPIKIVPIGEVASGSAISSITGNVQKVTLYGDENVLSTIEEIEVEIDVNGLSEDKTYQQTIAKPTGVRSMSESAITIKVKMEKETSREFEGIPIQMENLDDRFSALAASEADTKVNVIVRGTSSLLDQLKASDIKAFVDLSEVEPPEGSKEVEWEVAVQVTGTDLRLNYTSRQSKVKIILKRK